MGLYCSYRNERDRDKEIDRETGRETENYFYIISKNIFLCPFCYLIKQYLTEETSVCPQHLEPTEAGEEVFAL